jgi:hypothetical protein
MDDAYPEPPASYGPVRPPEPLPRPPELQLCSDITLPIGRSADSSGCC